jgi:hypothetical protein
VSMLDKSTSSGRLTHATESGTSGKFLEQALIAHHRGGVIPSLLPDR